MQTRGEVHANEGRYEARIVVVVVDLVHDGEQLSRDSGMREELMSN